MMWSLSRRLPDLFDTINQGWFPLEIRRYAKKQPWPPGRQTNALGTALSSADLCIPRAHTYGCPWPIPITTRLTGKRDNHCVTTCWLVDSTCTDLYMPREQTCGCHVHRYVDATFTNLWMPRAQTCGCARSTPRKLWLDSFYSSTTVVFQCQFFWMSAYKYRGPVEARGHRPVLHFSSSLNATDVMLQFRLTKRIVTSRETGSCQPDPCRRKKCTTPQI